MPNDTVTSRECYTSAWPGHTLWHKNSVELRWLKGIVSCAEINSSFYHVEVIGNFPKSDARGFFDRVRQAAGLAAINQEEWEDIYEVTLLG